ncbi:MAG: hypothetical protein HYY17_07490 [Planctomycetes bacterium]|nr:hypothetical protein [Planctomycetota bacterium]
MRIGPAALVLVILGALAVAVLAVFPAPGPTTGPAVSDTDVAYRLCEVALREAGRSLWISKTADAPPWDRILTEHAPLGTYPVDALRSFLAQRPSPDGSRFPLGRAAALGEGAVCVVVRDNDDGDGHPLRDGDDQVLLYVTAVLPSGASAQIEALVRYVPPDFVPEDAVLVGGSVAIEDAAAVSGSRGSVRSTGDIIVHPTAVCAAIHARSSAILPEVDPAAHRPEANFILRADGSILTAATLHSVRPGPGGWNGWSYDAPRKEWRHAGADMPPGTYYVEGNISIEGPGSRTLTLIAEGSVSITGLLRLSPALADTLVVAGGDVRCSAPAGAEFAGLVAAREQIQCSGGFLHRGVFVALDRADFHPLVPAGARRDPGTRFADSVRVTYDGGLRTLLRNPARSVELLSLRRLR